MRRAIRTIGWATNIFWIILLLFTITTVYSALQIRPGFGEPYTSASSSTLTVSLPFYIDNGGLYDITNLEVETSIKDDRDTLISDSSTIVPAIPHGKNVSATHNMAIDVSHMTSQDLSHLLLNDSLFNIDIVLGLDYANAVPFKVSTNFTMPWGAPLSNLTIGDVSVTYNLTHVRVSVFVSFENHSFFDLNGVMQLEVMDITSQVIGSGMTSIYVPQDGDFEDNVEVLLSGSPANIREAHLYFLTSVFNYGPVVIALG